MSDKKQIDDSVQTDSETTRYKTTHTAIRKARRFALQGLYEWHISNNPIHDIESHTRANNAMHTVHLGYYHELLHDIAKDVENLDTLIASKADRAMEKLDGVERAVLRIGTYELKERLEIPFKVVIDEAIQLNAHFGSVDGHKYINAVLDKLARELRTAEVDAQNQTKNSDTQPDNVQSDEDNDKQPDAKLSAQQDKKLSAKPDSKPNDKLSTKRDKLSLKPRTKCKHTAIDSSIDNASDTKD